MNTVEQVQQEYRQYLERCDAELGPVEFGEFAKYNGQLIKKLSYEEFELLYVEYDEMASMYVASLERGDTINDLVAKVLREHATKLLLPVPE